MQGEIEQHHERTAALTLVRRQRAARTAAEASLAAAQEGLAAASVRVATGVGSDEPSKAMAAVLEAEDAALSSSGGDNTTVGATASNIEAGSMSQEQAATRAAAPNHE